MGKIKTSFTKVLPFIYVFQIVLIAASNIINRFSHMVAIHSESMAWNGIAVFLRIVITLAVSPLHIGFYRFCFERVNGGRPHILTVFDFYRSAAGFARSAAAYLISLATAGFSTLMFSSLTMFSIFASRDENTGALFVAAVIALVILVLSELFFLTSYAYAESPSEGLIFAIKRSVKCGFKFMIVLILLNAAYMGINALVLKFYRDDIGYGIMGAGNTVNSENGIFNFFLMLTTGSVMKWIEFTAALLIFERERNNMLKDFFAKLKKGNGGEEVPENTEDTPFIEPYDFCIEADERFHDEKVIETEDIRGVDIIAVLEEMDLAFDIVNHFGIRRKLKKMYDDLAFDIGEYVSYEGGRSIENSFEEEIDERTFEVSAEITKDSDSEPFRLTVTVNVLTLEDE